MDILKAIGDSDLYTFHTHTQFCDGRAAMADFAVAAEKQGFTAIGFSPHSPIPVESTCNMSKQSVPEYLAEVLRLKEEYPAVKFYAGMEIDYLGPQWGPAIEYFQTMPLDFRIGSIHFIPNQKGEYIDIDGPFPHFKEKMESNFENDIHYVVNTYFDQSIKMVEAGGFDIIGHFDKVKHNGGCYLPGLEDTDWYQKRVSELIDCIVASGVIVEINTKAWIQHQQLFPSQKHWARLLKAGVPIIVNSDAHYPEKLNASRPEVLKALKYLKDK